MDRNRFDALARLLATTGSRRATLAAFLGVSLPGEDLDVFANRGKGKSKRKDHGSQGVQGEGRPGARHKQHHQHKQTQRQRRKKRRRNDHGGNQKPGREDGVCCGATTPCDPPAPGSSRAHCDFSEQSFADQDLHGTDLRQIAGAGTTFDGTDLHGARFAEACLRRATFVGANLMDTTWDGACLFAADFTGADLGDDAEALEAAVLCATILPDGTRADRDCDRSQDYPCCLPPPGGGGGGGPIPCKKDEDCPAFLECGLGFCDCNNHSCPGCCDEERLTCHPGNTNEHCGHPPKQFPGNMCQTCLVGTTCVNGGCAAV